MRRKIKYLILVILFTSPVSQPAGASNDSIVVSLSLSLFLIPQSGNPLLKNMSRILMLTTTGGGRISGPATYSKRRSAEL